MNTGSKDPYERMMATLEWLDSLGGMGYEKHEMAREAVEYAKKHRNDQAQVLVDMMFSVALMSAEFNGKRTRNEISDWVAHNLRGMGFYTYPVGSSWGVLCTKEKYEELLPLLKADRRTSDDQIVETRRAHDPHLLSTGDRTACDASGRDGTCSVCGSSYADRTAAEIEAAVLKSPGVSVIETTDDRWEGIDEAAVQEYVVSALAHIASLFLQPWNKVGVTDPKILEAIANKDIQAFQNLVKPLTHMEEAIAKGENSG